MSDLPQPTIESGAQQEREDQEWVLTQAEFAELVERQNHSERMLTEILERMTPAPASQETPPVSSQPVEPEGSEPETPEASELILAPAAPASPEPKTGKRRKRRLGLKRR